jgi:predicted metal-binding membrane protein
VNHPAGFGRATPDGHGPGLPASAQLQRGQLVVFITLILLTIAAWGVTIIQTQSMAGRMDVVVEPAAPDDPMDAMGGMSSMDDMTVMPEMDEMESPGMGDMAGTGWSLAALAAFVVSWAVMMAAMMLPAVAPLLLLYRTVAGKSMPGNRAFISTWMLVGGYLLVWTAVGVGVYVLSRLSGEVAGQFGMTEQQRWGPVVLGAILVAAGVYQFTPLKYACLRQCQSPFGFLMGHWRGGKLGALRMGLVHGLYCLGCCWALFAVLVAAGIMSLAWMLLLTLVVFAEKVLPMGRRAAYGVGAAFLVLGILVGSAKVTMPGMV